MGPGAGRQHLHRRRRRDHALHRHGGDAIRGDVPLFSSTRSRFGNTSDSVVADKAELPLSG